MASEGSRLLDEALKLMAEAIKVKLAEMEPTSDVASPSALAKGTFTPEEVAQMEPSSGVVCASAAVEGTNTLGEISVDVEMEPNFDVVSSSASSEGSVAPGEVVEAARVESIASASTGVNGIMNAYRNSYPKWRMVKGKFPVYYVIMLGKHFGEKVHEIENLENTLQKGTFKKAFNELGGGTSLHWAVRLEDVEAVTYILEACKEDIDEQDEWWRATALHWAVRIGNMAIMNAMCTHHLESKKFDLGVLDRWGFTALEYAIFKSDVPMVEALLRFGIGHSDPTGVIKEVSDELRKGGSMEVHQQYFESQRERWYESIRIERGGHLETLFQWALLMEDTSLATQFLTKSEEYVNHTDSSNCTPLHLAVLTRNLDMVKMMVADSKVHVNATNTEGTTPLQMAVLLGQSAMVKIMVDTHLELGNFDVNYAEWRTAHSILHCAVLNGEEENVDIVRELLRCKDTMRLTEECKTGETPLQIAHERGFKDIEKSLLECEGVQRYMDQLYRDRQVYVDAANAILVGAALIASVTFASWLQPPLGYGTLGLVDVQHNRALRAFWIFNCLSFYFAIGTVVFGARSVLPRSPYFIKVTVEKLQTNLLVTASLLACSVFFVIIAFGIAGCLVLSPMLEFQLYMIVPAIGGGLVCIISLVFLSKSMWEDSSLGKSTVLVKGMKWKKASLVKSENVAKVQEGTFKELETRE